MAQITNENKISLYPIDVSMEGDGGPYKAQAYKINSTGMILEVFVSTLSPHQILKLKWVLPIENISMESDAIIMKTYAQPKGNKIQHLIEVHYKNLKPQNADAIKSLLHRYEAKLKKPNDDKQAVAIAKKKSRP